MGRYYALYYNSSLFLDIYFEVPLVFREAFFVPKLNICSFFVRNQFTNFTASHLTTMKKLARKIEMLLHALLTGVLIFRAVLLIKDGLYYPGGIMMGLLLAAVVISLFWKQLKLAPRDARLACYYLEAPTLLLNYVVFNIEGDVLAAQVCLIATVSLPFIGYATAIKTHRKRKVA